MCHLAFFGLSSKHRSLPVLATTFTAVLSAITACPVAAQQIANRATLNTLLANGSSKDTFEIFNVPNNSPASVPSTLDATTITNKQGPGLVSPGVTYTSIATTGGALASSLQINGANYFGQPSRDLLSNATILRIAFSTSVTAYGLDLTTYATFPDTATIRTYAADGTTLVNTTSGLALSISTPSVPTFYGFQNATGIGAVELQGTQPYSPIIDNVQFGNAAAGSTAPEPGSAGLLLTCVLPLGGLAARRRHRS